MPASPPDLAFVIDVPVFTMTLVTADVLLFAVATAATLALLGRRAHRGPRRTQA